MPELIKYPVGIPSALYDKVTEASRALGESRASWIRQAIRDRLDRDLGRGAGKPDDA